MTENPLRIGYLMQNGVPDLDEISGPQIHIVSVINELARQGHDVRTISYRQENPGWSDDLRRWLPLRFGYSASRWFRLVERPIRRIQHELKLPYVGIFESLRFADACSTLLSDPDVLYERHGYMGFGGVIAARRLGVPLIIELNGNIVKEIDEMGVQMSARQRRLGKMITYRTLAAANHIVVVADALRRVLVQEAGIPEENISVIPNGANVDLFSRPFNANQVRAEFEIEPLPTVVFAGSFQPWHGVDLLVASFEEVRARFSNAQLLLIGDGPLRSELELRIERQGLGNGVRMLGRLSQAEVAAVLSVADVVVAPYPFQHRDIVGTPLKLVEYLAAGKAIVATTAPIHEIISDGITGLRVEPADEQALAAGICRLLGDSELRECLARNARLDARNYTWENVGAALDEIYRRVISDSQQANG